MGRSDGCHDRSLLATAWWHYAAFESSRAVRVYHRNQWSRLVERFIGLLEDARAGNQRLLPRQTSGGCSSWCFTDHSCSLECCISIGTSTYPKEGQAHSTQQCKRLYEAAHST